MDSERGRRQARLVTSLRGLEKWLCPFQMLNANLSCQCSSAFANIYSSYHTNPLLTCVGPIPKNLSPFAFASLGQIRGMGEGACPTPWFIFVLVGDGQFVFGKSWQAELLLERRNQSTATDINASLFSFALTYLIIIAPNASPSL